MLPIKSMGTFVKLFSGECHKSTLMISQHWFRWWFSAIGQQAINWADVGPDLCHHMALLGHNELIWCFHIINERKSSTPIPPPTQTIGVHVFVWHTVYILYWMKHLSFQCRFLLTISLPSMSTGSKPDVGSWSVQHVQLQPADSGQDWNPVLILVKSCNTVQYIVILQIMYQCR